MRIKTFTLPPKFSLEMLGLPVGWVPWLCCAGSLWLHGLFSGCSEQGLPSSCSAPAPSCSGFSRCGAQASAAAAQGLGGRGSGAAECRLSCSSACPQDLPQPGIKPWRSLYQSHEGCLSFPTLKIVAVPNCFS